jgi:LacI family transcriptional regulator
VAIQDGASTTPATIRDVARLAGVHISTVSRALDPTKASLLSRATRDKVISAADQLGYRPHLVASGLRRGRTRTIGVVVPDLGNPVYAPVVRGIAHALGHDGFMPLVADTEDDHDNFERVLAHLAGRRVDGIITTAPRSGDAALLQQLVDGGIPVVIAVRTLPGSGLPTIVHDDLRGGRLAAEHLLDLGHTAIAQLSGPHDVEAFRARSAGFEAALEEAGVPVPTRTAADAPTTEEGERLAREILVRDPRPTAVFAGNDMLALGVFTALGELGLAAPDDVSVVGYNDSFFAPHTQPPLTTVRLPAYDVGLAAGTLTLELVAGREVDESPSVPPELIVRASTAAPTA